MSAPRKLIVGGVGSRFPVRCQPRRFAAGGPVLTFAMAVLLIADLDRPIEGMLLVGLRPIAELNKMLKADQEAP